MKKIFFWFLLASFVLVPAYSYAQNVSVADLQAQITSLLAQIEQLKAQLKTQQDTSVTVPWCYTFEKNLRIGDGGNEISQLVTVLNKEGLLSGKTDIFDEEVASAVVGLQEKYKSEILTPNNLVRGTGYVGISTRAKLNRLYGCGTTPIPRPDVAYEQVKCVFNSSATEQKCSGIGAYTTTSNNTEVRPPQFSCSGVGTCVADVKGSSGTRLVWSSSCSGSAYTTIDGRNEYAEFRCGGSTAPIAVISPNGGESWQKGTTQTITWRGVSPVTCINDVSSSVSAPCYIPQESYYDITLLAYYPPCTGQVCPAYAIQPYTIAKKVAGNSYSWGVGKIADPYNGLAPDGAYTVQVCQTSTNSCDSSDSYFKIYSGTSTNRPPVISGLDAPTSLSVGQTGTWTVKAYDSDGTSLSYSVWWGDEVYAQSGNVSSSATQSFTQSATFTHSYATAGTYTPQFTVSDASGQLVQTSASVRVGVVSTQPLTVVSPNGGETWQRGTTQTIKWQDNRTSVQCPEGAYCMPPAPRYYNVTLQQHPTCTGPVCPAIYSIDYPIATGVYGSSYNWNVGKIIDSYGSGESSPDGAYTVQVCQSGAGTPCDSSDSHFKIYSPNDAISPTSSSGSTSLNSSSLAAVGATLDSMTALLNQLLWSLVQ